MSGIRYLAALLQVYHADINIFIRYWLCREVGEMILREISTHVTSCTREPPLPCSFIRELSGMEYIHRLSTFMMSNLRSSRRPTTISISLSMCRQLILQRKTRSNMIFFRLVLQLHPPYLETGREQAGVLEHCSLLPGVYEISEHQTIRSDWPHTF